MERERDTRESIKRELIERESRGKERNGENNIWVKVGNKILFKWGVFV